MLSLIHIYKKRPNSVPHTPGVPKGVLDSVIVLPFNDLENTMNILEAHKNDLACVLIDPMPHRINMEPASKEYVNTIYEWTRKNGSLLCFDEVITFRVNYSGLQEYYNVKPDLTSLGKIIGGDVYKRQELISQLEYQWADKFVSMFNFIIDQYGNSNN